MQTNKSQAEDKVTKNPDSAIGAYINFLHIGNLIVLPVFEIEGNRDDDAQELMHELYPKHKIETIQVNEIAVKGGVLNCISWNILK